MVSLKCKSCGENIPVDSNETSVTCPCCGNNYDVPMDEKKEQYLNLYSRADDAWAHNDFEEASELYQQILNGDNTQAEAHFGLVLCKYGITYETDQITHKKMPTCNRINRDSILDDKHYAAAIKYASKEAAASFQKRAQEIERISQDFLKIVDKEPPYDVFISYKKTSEDGSATQDSKVARKLYFHLKEKGFKVFFAEETLKSVGGEKYEPYIFAALSSAPVMVLIGSKREYFDAMWVKNEWRRYLVLMSQGLKKTLIPTYFEMDPYHMPGELRNLQAMNAADFTFQEDITEIIRKKVADAKDGQISDGTQGVSLRDKYAQKEKVDSIVKATDCEREFAVNVLIQCHGDVKKSQQFIEEDPEYKKALWICAECQSKNTHDKCQTCGVTKKESIEVERARKEMEIRERKKSDEYKQKRSALIAGILVPVIIIGLIASLIYFVIWPKLIFPNMSTDDFNTPEIVKTYSGAYKTANVTGEAIITIKSCDTSGNVSGTYEFIVGNIYGKYEVSGKITSKKNNGNLEMSLSPGKWVIQPEKYSQLEVMEIEISDDYKTLECSKYQMNWSAGENDKYFIKTAEDLKKLSGSSLTYQLKNDIDLSGVSWAPIDNFSGTLIGNGFSIKNMSIEASSSNVGMFSTLSGFVSNLKFENASIKVSGRNENVGILCGNLEGNISGVSVSGNVEASKCTNVGGIFGYASRSINNDINLIDLTNSATVNGLNNVGGIVGYTDIAYVNLSFSSLKNAGKITAEEDYVGGIAGRMDADTAMSSDPIVQIAECENTGDVNGRYYVGGIAGYVKGYYDDGTVIENSSCKANIKGEAYVGCIAGQTVNIPINNCVNEGSTLTATGSINEDNKRCAFVGGFVGNGFMVSNCTNEVEIKYTAGGSYVGGIIGYADRNISPDFLTYKNVKNNAPVYGADYVGGIAGYLYCAYITLQVESAVNTAAVYGNGDYVGGIIGFGRSSDRDGYFYIYDSDNTGAISGNNYVGGIIGYGRATYDDSAISNSSSTGSIKGNSKTGNIAGELDTMQIK